MSFCFFFPSFTQHDRKFSNQKTQLEQAKDQCNAQLALQRRYLGTLRELQQAVAVFQGTPKATK